jgi:hypothetical protein
MRAKSLLLLALFAVGSRAQTISAISVTPNSGSGLTQTFSFLVSDYTGASNLTQVWMDFATSLGVDPGCFPRYDAGPNGLYLLNDAHTIWLGPIVPGSSSTLTNSQCALNAAGSVVSKAGNNMTVSISLTFQPAFAGAKNVYLYGNNATVNSGWQTVGSWTVLGPVTLTGVSPAAGPTGTAVTIFGNGFGASQGTSTVTFKGANAGAATTWSPTSITVNVPSAASTGNVVVTVGGVASNGMVFTVSQSGGDTGTWAAGSGGSVYFTGGNVGIGTTSPQHLLQIAGTIGAEEVIVSSTGADYVFDPGYRLAPLTEIAEYVARHHHLPAIPAADEMKNGGVSVGEMQAKLLAKIEELTLYMIQQEEQNLELRRRIAQLEQGGVTNTPQAKGK